MEISFSFDVDVVFVVFDVVVFGCEVIGWSNVVKQISIVILTTVLCLAINIVYLQI